jgi:hypothetical protein
MSMMPLRIKIFFHALNQLVYSIFLSPVSINNNIYPQEDNDQAFPVIG